MNLYAHTSGKLKLYHSFFKDIRRFQLHTDMSRFIEFAVSRFPEGNAFLDVLPVYAKLY